MLTHQNPKALEGKALLKKVQELSDLSRREKAKECGYYKITETGEAKVELVEFYNALLDARDIPLNPDRGKDSRGREPTYRVSVHKNGQIVIGSTYTRKMGLQPGDEFEIKLVHKNIHLKPLNKIDNNSAAWQAYLESEKEREEVYRSLANA
ncbi:MAG: AbrB family transcriptional regulator [Xenococcus sp. (in: cyanobacteria)]